MKLLRWLLFSLSFIPLWAEEFDLIPPPVCHNIWWADVEFLYWRAFEGEIDFADKFNSMIGTLPADEQLLKFRFKPGVRVKAGYVNTNCLWDATFNYTFYTSKPHNSVTGTLFPSLNFFGSPSGGITTVTSAQMDWNLKFQYADLDLGRPIWWGDRFALHPHIGVRGASIQQHGNVKYSGGSLTTGSFLIHLKNNFRGIGFKTGLDGHYQLCSCLSLFSDVSAALLWGHFHLQQIQNQLGVNQVNLSTCFHQPTPCAQAALGVAWQKTLSRWCSLSSSVPQWRGNIGGGKTTWSVSQIQIPRSMWKLYKILRFLA